MNHIWIALVAGVGGFAHCLGMCGGFPLHLSRGRSRSEMLVRQLLWHGGKTFSYMFLGALAGMLGGWLGGVTVIPKIQDVLAYAAGGVMILMGASLLGFFPWRVRLAPNAQAGEADGLLPAIFRQFLVQPTAAGALALGLATGFLPCPIVLAFLAYSVESGSPATGMAVMAALGVGTVWSLLLLGLSGHAVNRWLRGPPIIGNLKVSAAIRKCGTAAPGVILVLLGLATVLRGTEAFHRILGCPPAVAQQTGAAPCCCAEHPNP